MIESIPSVAQTNLVINPGFEDHDSCPTQYSDIGYCKFWTEATNGSSDYFNECSPLIVNPLTNPFFGYQVPHSGKGMCGIWCLKDGSEYREYLEGQLMQPLVAGHSYFVSFFVNLSSINLDDVRHYHAAISDIGLYFSKFKIDSSMITWHIGAKPQILNRASNMLIDTANWIQITGKYVATGGENYVTIGNFSSDNNTHAISYFQGNLNSYYYFDDVSVTPIEEVSILNDSAFVCNGLKTVIKGTWPDTIGTWNDSLNADSISVTKPGKYWKIMQLNGRFYIDTVVVVEKDCGCQLFIPNTFTPNRNGVNDAFKIEDNCEVSVYAMSIYNRWGECLFKSDDINKGWDGKFREKPCPEGVYFYQLKLQYPEGRSELYKGKIMIIRNNEF